MSRLTGSIDPHEAQAQRLNNIRLVNEFVCEKCHGALAERHLTHVGSSNAAGQPLVMADEFIVICPVHGADGFITREAALDTEAQEALDKMEIPDAEQRKKLGRGLWGEE